MRLARAGLTLPVLALLHIHIHIHLHHHFRGPPFDYVGLAAAAAASWIGLPGPGEPVLIAAGILAAKHHLDIVSVVLVAFVAATAGGVVGWLIGLKAGRAFLTAPGPLFSLRVNAVRRGEEVFARHPVLAIVLTPAWVAGIHRVRAAVYQPTNVITAALWAAGIGFGAYFVGPPIVELVDDWGLATGIIVGTVIVAVVVLELVRRRRKRSRR